VPGSAGRYSVNVFLLSAKVQTAQRLRIFGLSRADFVVEMFFNLTGLNIHESVTFLMGLKFDMLEN
jgi:hypothetical protein